MKEAIEQLSKLYDSRFEKIEESVRTLQAEFSKPNTKVDELDLRLTKLEGTSLSNELNKYKFSIGPPAGGFNGRHCFLRRSKISCRRIPVATYQL